MSDLETYYLTPSRPSAFGGKTNLKRYLTKDKKKDLFNEADDWLSGQDPYTLHRPIVRKFPRRKTIVAGPNQQIQADLVDVSGHARHNENHKFILTAIDVFSKKAWAFPLKNKTGAEVARALSSLFVQTSPRFLQTDKGREFLNAEVRSVLDRFKVGHFSSESDDVKAAIVERFNKSLRSSLHRYFTKIGKERFIDVLPEFVTAYNERYHKALGMSPNQVSSANQEDVWYRLYDPISAFEKPLAKLEVGDFVRITKARTPFTRGYTPNWSYEVFKIDKILKTTPITYRIKDWDGEPVKGSFYEKELQKIKEPTTFKIEKILRRKTVGRKKMVYVKWLGYPDSFNQWIPEEDVVDVN